MNTKGISAVVAGGTSYSCPNKRLMGRPAGANPKSLFADACQNVAWNEGSEKFLEGGQ